MSDEPRYSEILTISEYRIAACEEIDLEEIVWRQRDPPSDLLKRYYEADKKALREIERLKIAGEYEAERARLASFLEQEPTPPTVERYMQRSADGEFESLQNFLDGLSSPDPAQRERFERLYRETGLADKAPSEVWHVLDCLEKAKKPAGRPTASPPWRNVFSALDSMRVAVAGGATIPKAARDEAAREGHAHQDSRAKHFERLYRFRAALRN